MRTCVLLRLRACSRQCVRMSVCARVSVCACQCVRLQCGRVSLRAYSRQCVLVSVCARVSVCDCTRVYAADLEHVGAVEIYSHVLVARSVPNINVMVVSMFKAEPWHPI